MKNTTNNFRLATEENEILKAEKGDTIYLEYFDSDMDGIFPRINEWTRFINKIDREGISNWFEKNAKYYGIKKLTEISYDNYKIEFDKPIQSVIATVDNKQIIENIKSMNIELNYSFLYGRDNRANGIEIMFKIISL